MDDHPPKSNESPWDDVSGSGEGPTLIDRKDLPCDVPNPPVKRFTNTDYQIPQTKTNNKLAFLWCDRCHGLQEMKVRSPIPISPFIVGLLGFGIGVGGMMLGTIHPLSSSMCIGGSIFFGAAYIVENIRKKRNWVCTRCGSEYPKS